MKLVRTRCSRRRWLALAAFWCGGVLGCRPEPKPVPRAEKIPRRIVSVVPSVTETLFALGFGERVAGVSDYCDYPPETAPIPKIGGLYNPNLERILELRPDLVILLKEHSELKARLSAAGLSTLTVDHSSVPEILDSFEVIAGRCGNPEAGTSLRRAAEQRAETLRAKNEGERVRTLIVIDRDLTERRISQVYAAGKNPYFDEILDMAGGVSVLADLSAPVPTVSREGILETNPDVIIDLSASVGGKREGEPGAAEWTETCRRDWDSLGENVAAVKNRRVYPVLADYATVPGPRFIDFAELLSSLLHSERELAEIQKFGIITEYGNGPGRFI